FQTRDVQKTAEQRGFVYIPGYWAGANKSFDCRTVRYSYGCEHRPHPRSAGPDPRAQLERPVHAAIPAPGHGGRRRRARFGAGRSVAGRRQPVSRSATALKPPVRTIQPAPPDKGGWVRRLLPFLAAHKGNVAIAFGVSIFGMIVTALTPVIEKVVIDDVIIE